MTVTCRVKHAELLIEYVQSPPKATIGQAARHLLRSPGYIRSLAQNEAKGGVRIMHRDRSVRDWELVRREV